MEIDVNTIEEVVRRVTRVVQADRIILFGSAAHGAMTRDSDIDLLIVKTAIEDVGEEWFRIQESLRGMGYPFDIILMTCERFEETKNVIGGIAYPAQRSGRIIYEAA